MPLIKRIEEVRKSLRISTLSKDGSLPDIEEAEQIYIIPALGDELFNELQEAYNNQSIDAETLLLISLIQKPLAAYAYLDNIALIHVTITDAGIRRFTSDGTPAAFAWEYREVTKALANKAMSGMEVLLTYLEKNVSKWPKWQNSPTRKDRNSLLIRSGTEFNSNYPLFQKMRTYYSLRSIITEVQDNYIIPSIGATFFNSLLTNNIVDEHINEVIRLLKKSICHYSIKHAVEQRTVDVTDQGFTILVSSGSNDVEAAGRSSAPTSLLDSKKQAADRAGSIYLRKSISYLNKFASSNIFPLYFNSEKYSPTGSGAYDRGNASRKTFRF
jgi:hypothetical protein